MTAFEAGRVGHTSAGELDIDLQILALCIGAAILSLWVARNRVREVRAEMIKLAGASQRPVNLPKAARTEAQHYFVMAGEIDQDDKPTIAKAVRMTETELDQAIEQARALAPDPSLADYAYLWYDRRAKRRAVYPPLPPEMLERSFVHAL
jgi:hypothetical protein